MKPSCRRLFHSWRMVVSVQACESHALTTCCTCCVPLQRCADWNACTVTAAARGVCATPGGRGLCATSCSATTAVTPMASAPTAPASATRAGTANTAPSVSCRLGSGRSGYVLYGWCGLVSGELLAGTEIPAG